MEDGGGGGNKLGGGTLRATPAQARGWGSPQLKEAAQDQLPLLKVQQFAAQGRGVWPTYLQRGGGGGLAQGKKVGDTLYISSKKVPTTD